eukprot:scaffold613949_cov19-Prasinocladus_malaysianus.AAC.1
MATDSLPPATTIGRHEVTAARCRPRNATVAALAASHDDRSVRARLLPIATAASTKSASIYALSLTNTRVAALTIYSFSKLTIDGP